MFIREGDISRLQEASMRSLSSSREQVVSANKLGIEGLILLFLGYGTYKRKRVVGSIQ